MNTNFLEKIRSSVEQRVALLPQMEGLQPNTLDFCQIFKNSQKPTVISEIKFASPSRGLIYKGKLDPTSIASEYLAAGAAALSVLVEPHYFKGDISYVSDIRKTHPTARILLKDFIISKKQIAQGLLYGVNAVLLIAGFLDKNTIQELYDYSLHLGLTPVVEVHDIKELEYVLKLSPSVIGVNNRNLQTLEITLDTARKLIKYIPDECYTICESGIENPVQIQEMVNCGFDGFLIGSSLMKQNNPGHALKKLLMQAIL